METNTNDTSLKKGFFSKLDNFWYHYKWHTLIALFFIMIIAVGMFQMCSKEKYDIFILYAGEDDFDRTKSDGDIYSDYESARVNLTKVIKDYDGNGTKSVMLRDLFLLTPEQVTEANKTEGAEVNELLLKENKSTFLDTIRYSDYYLCILSKEVYLEYKTIDGVDIFEDLSDIPKNSLTRMLDDCAVYLNSTKFAELAPFDSLPDDTVIVLRKINALTKKMDKEDAERHYGRAKETLEKIINYGL